MMKKSWRFIRAIVESKLAPELRRVLAWSAAPSSRPGYLDLAVRRRMERGLN